MKQNNKIIYATIVILILGAGVAGLGFFSKTETQLNEPVVTADTSKEFFTIRVPSSQSSSMYETELADKLGYFDEVGIKIEYTGVINGGPEAMMSVATGANDATSGGGAHISAAVNAIAQGLKIKVVLPLSGTNQNSTSAFFVLNNSGIFTAKDFKGKKFAINTFGAANDYAVQEFLKQNKINKDDVDIIVIGSQATREQAFRTGQVDIISGNNRLYTFTEGGGVRPLFRTYDLYRRNMPGALLFMNEKFINEHPDIVRRYVAANVKAIDWAKAHPEEAREIFRKIIIDANGTRGKPIDADYWDGLGIDNHGLVEDDDFQYWIDIVGNGTLKITPADIYTNEFNPFYKK